MRRFRTAYLLVVLAFATGGMLPQLVLCTGASGHREVELRDAACCHPLKAAGTTQRIQTLRFGCAADCNDLPLGVVAATQRPGKANTAATLALLPSNELIVAAGVTDKPALAYPLPAPNSMLRVLRSTVALC